MKEVATSISIALIVIAICLASTYACVDSNRAYNERATACIKAKGSWVTQNSGGGMCIASGVQAELSR